MLLSNKEIIEFMKKGDIVIDPFVLKHLGPNSYDLTIDRFYCAQLEMHQRPDPEPDPFWGHRLQKGLWVKGHNMWEVREASEDYIVVMPKRLILARTAESVGCVRNCVGEMKSRSTVMRSGLAVCIDAGMGDVGYEGQWTMEIYNHLDSPIFVDVGARIAQMVFHRVGEVDEDYYEKGGTYSTLEFGGPEDMIPRSRV